MRALLECEDDLLVVGETDNGHHALREVRRLQPQIVLLDLGLPDADGLETISQLRSEAPETKVVVLTMYDDSDYVLHAIAAGAAGCVAKAGHSPGVLASLRAALERA